MQVLRADMTFILLRHKCVRYKIQRILSSTMALSCLTVIGEAAIITVAFVLVRIYFLRPLTLSMIIYHQKHCASREMYRISNFISNQTWCYPFK